MKNYLFALYPEFPKGFKLDERLDPDSCSKELYIDLHKYLFSNKQLNEKNGIYDIDNKSQKNGNGSEFSTLYINGNKHLLSADYIGPSTYWAEEAGLQDNEIVKFLEISRTLGGHMLWPRSGYKPTVNQARGGKYGYYDRIDLTLFALKQWYENKNQQTLLTPSFNGYSQWFDYS